MDFSIFNSILDSLAASLGASPSKYLVLLGAVFSVLSSLLRAVAAYKAARQLPTPPPTPQLPAPPEKPLLPPPLPERHRLKQTRRRPK